MTAEVRVNLNVKEVTDKVKEASRLAMRDTVVAVIEDAVEFSPWLTTNNRRRLTGEVSGMGMVASGGDGSDERQVDDDKVEGAVYSTSGYGGYLEVRVVKARNGMQPYIKPAVDRNFTDSKFAARVRRHLK